MSQTQNPAAPEAPIPLTLKSLLNELLTAKCSMSVENGVLHLEDGRSIDLGAALKPAYVVVQEGGSSEELYVHAHSSAEAAEEDRIDCAEDGAYSTTEVVEIPAVLAALGETFYETLDEIIGSLSSMECYEAPPERKAEYVKDMVSKLTDEQLIALLDEAYGTPSRSRTKNLSKLRQQVCKGVAENDIDLQDVRELVDSAEQAAAQIAANSISEKVRLAVQGLGREQLEDILDEAYGVGCCDDQDRDDLRKLVLQGLVEGKISAESVLERA